MNSFQKEWKATSALHRNKYGDSLQKNEQRKEIGCIKEE